MGGGGVLGAGVEGVDVDEVVDDDVEVCVVVWSGADGFAVGLEDGMEAGNSLEALSELCPQPVARMLPVKATTPKNFFICPSFISQKAGLSNRYFIRASFGGMKFPQACSGFVRTTIFVVAAIRRMAVRRRADGGYL